MDRSMGLALCLSAADDDENPAALIQTARSFSPLPAAPVTTPAASNPAADYAPGVIRSSTDREAALVEAFYRRHPEYELLPRDAVLQVAATYLDEDDHALRAALADEGVPVGGEFCGFDDPEAEEGSDYR